MTIGNCFSLWKAWARKVLPKTHQHNVSLTTGTMHGKISNTNDECTLLFSEQPTNNHSAVRNVQFIEHLIALQKLPGKLASWERSSHLLDLLLNRLQDLSSAEEASQICQKQAGTRPPFWKERPAYSMQESGKKSERTITHAVMEKSYSQVECLICKSCCFKTTFWEVTTSKCTPSNNHLW